MFPTSFILTLLQQGINRVLRIEPDLLIPLSGIEGFRYFFHVLETRRVIAMKFERGQLELVEVTKDAFDVSDNTHCWVEISVLELDSFPKSHEITQLIREQKLDIKGNMKAIQRLADVAREEHWDIEETLSKYVGDVFAHQLVSALEQKFERSKTAAKQAKSIARDALVDEYKLLVDRSRFDAFVEANRALQGRLEKLQQRIEQRCRQ